MATKEDGKWKPAKPIKTAEIHPPKDTELLSGVSHVLQQLSELHYRNEGVYQKLLVLYKSLLSNPVVGHRQIIFRNPSSMDTGPERFLRGHVPKINDKGDLGFTPDEGNIFSSAHPGVEVLQTKPQEKVVSSWNYHDLLLFLSYLGLETDLNDNEWRSRSSVLKEQLVNKKVKEFTDDASRVNSLSKESIKKIIDEARPRTTQNIGSRVGLRITEINKKTKELVETFTVYIVKKEDWTPFSYNRGWQIEVVCGNKESARYDWGQDIDWTQTALVRKPVIYLYPTQPTEVSVNLDFTRGPVVVEYPKRENGSWVVNAQPDGKLLVGDKEYPYLFWEAKPKTPYQFDQTEGFCLGKDEFVPFFEEKLKLLGLNDKEIADFITYWYPLMANNPYTYVNFLGQEYLDSAKLTVSPSPESIIRVFVVFKSMTEKVNLKPQELVETPRNGFTLVEWGGSNLDDK